MLSLAGKKILVTGGSRGIGASIVSTLDQLGAHVAFTYTSKPEAAELVRSQLSRPQDHQAFALHLQDEAQVNQQMQEILNFFGGTLDGVVNNAGITKDQLFMRMKTEDFDQVMQVNLRGTFLVTRAAIKTMVKQRFGSIVNITSVIGQTGNPGQANYAASKAGVELMSRSLALEVASRGVRINCVAPGFIATEMTEQLNDQQKDSIVSKIPMQRVAQAHEVAQVVAFLLSDGASYITGSTINVNGGLFMN